MHDDNWFKHVFAAEYLDGVGQDDRRFAMLCTVVNTTSLNVARASGTNMPDDLYRDENFYLPKHHRISKRHKTQSIGQMAKVIGF